MVREELSLTQVLAEEKSVKRQIQTLISRDDFKFVSWCLKNSQYVGPRSRVEQIQHQQSQFQQLVDLMTRWSALRKAHTHANHTTMITVPCEPDFRSLIKGKEVETEEISIAEAINRKNVFKGRKKKDLTNDDMPLSLLASHLVNQYNIDLWQRQDYEKKAKEEVEQQMARKFPADSKQSWSQEKYNEEKQREESLVEIIRIDPNEFITNDAINKYKVAVDDYVTRIDSIISEANASTKVVVEY